MADYHNLKHFSFWCQKVLPLVYDDSLSYYEILCKVVDYINSIIGDSNSIVTDIDELKADMEVVKKWIADFDTTFIEKIVKDYVTQVIKAVTFGISSEGYFMAVSPEHWSDIRFGTIQTGELYGHLTLSYD